jgi:hypothetical protein
MKIRVVAYYPPNSDFEALETQKPLEIVLFSEEISYTGEQLYSIFQDPFHQFEIQSNLVIDQGYNSEDNFFDLILNEVCASPSEANSKASRVLEYALSLI